MLDFIRPSWRAPETVRAVSTTRSGGRSRGAYASLNLADHVGDRADHVAINRATVARALELPDSPVWLRQVHGAAVVDAARSAPGTEGDGTWTDRPGQVCAVLTADCLPVLLCDTEGTRVAALHAGWRGLAAGVLEQGVAALGGAPERLLAWTGPAIGATVFEVGEEVREALCAGRPRAEAFFVPAQRSGHWLADLRGLAGERLRACGLSEVSHDEGCTLSEADRYFSYRRDGACGRMATLIWLA